MRREKIERRKRFFWGLLWTLPLPSLSFALISFILYIIDPSFDPNSSPFLLFHVLYFIRYPFWFFNHTRYSVLHKKKMSVCQRLASFLAIPLLCTSLHFQYAISDLKYQVDVTGESHIAVISLSLSVSGEFFDAWHRVDDPRGWSDCTFQVWHLRSVGRGN